MIAAMLWLIGRMPFDLCLPLQGPLTHTRTVSFGEKRQPALHTHTTISKTPPSTAPLPKSAPGTRYSECMGVCVWTLPLWVYLSTSWECSVKSNCVSYLWLPRKPRGEAKKCRKVYGMEKRDMWCTACRWKKACQRFNDWTPLHHCDGLFLCQSFTEVESSTGEMWVFSLMKLLRARTASSWPAGVSLLASLNPQTAKHTKHKNKWMKKEKKL